jgi:hypothetical protein
MKNFNYYQIVLFIIILLKVSNCANKYENEREKVEKSLPREKRVIQAASSAFAAYKIVKEVFEEARNAYKCLKQGGKDCLEKIIDSFLNDDDQVLKNFDKVFDKLDKISNQLSTELKCEFLEQEYNNIWKLISRILKKVKIFINNRNNKNLKKDLQNLCRDHSEGIDKIHSLIENYLEEKKLIKISLNCYKYNFDELEEFHYITLTMILQFMIVSSNCENLFNYNEFDYNKYWHETENYLNYYKDYFFPLQFLKDSEHNGFSQSVKRILITDQEAQKIVEHLNKAYSYFDWSVIIYDKAFESKNFLSYKQISNNSLCGSKIFSEDVKLFGTDRDAIALVSYCYTKELENENIKIELYKNNPRMSTIETVKMNKNLNYVLTVKIPQCTYNYYTPEYFFYLEINRYKLPFGSVEWVNCEYNKIRFLDFYGSYKSESFLTEITEICDNNRYGVFGFISNVLNNQLLDKKFCEKKSMKIFASNMVIGSSMSKPKTTSQSFSLPENEVESNLNFKQGKYLC